MRHLDLQEITFYILNLEKDEEKRKYMEGQMQEMGFSYVFVKGLETNPGMAGVALSHLKALRLADGELPFAILEDDCRFLFDRINTKINIPKSTDAFYFGHSHFGLKEKDHQGVRWGQPKGAKYSIFNEQYLKIESMLARHGILYLSEKFRQSAIQANLDALSHFEFNYPGDLAYANMLSDHLVLAPHQPWCYQSEIFNGNWVATRASLLETVPPSTDNLT